MAKQQSAPPALEKLPLDGQSRWAQIAPFLPFARETARKLEQQGRFPKRVRITERCSMFSNRELHRWFADPVGYRDINGVSYDRKD